MSVFKDPDGVVYAHPERSCKNCLNFPCLDNMQELRSDFAKYGCIRWSNKDVFKINKLPRKTRGPHTTC